MWVQASVLVVCSSLSEGDGGGYIFGYIFGKSWYFWPPGPDFNTSWGQITMFPPLDRAQKLGTGADQGQKWIQHQTWLVGRRLGWFESQLGKLGLGWGVWPLTGLAQVQWPT